MAYTLNTLVSLWKNKLRLAKDTKNKRFGKEHKEIMRFYHGPHDFVYSGDRDGESFLVGGFGSGNAPPGHRITVNKTAEFVDLFLPVLYHRNPVRSITAKGDPVDVRDLLQAGLGLPDPAAKAKRTLKADLLAWYVNYTPNELELKENARAMCFDALTAGRGVLWTQLVPTASGRYMVGSFYDSVENLFIDPDATSWKRASWIARKRVLPVWEVERIFKLPRGMLRANRESYNQQAKVDSDPEYDPGRDRGNGQTNDLIEFHEIYSRMGLGGRLVGADDQMRDDLEVYGDEAFLVIAEGVPFPLNLPPHLIQMPDWQEQLRSATRWPVPFYKDHTDPWPCTVCDLKPLPTEAWPVAPLQMAMGEQEFLDWAYSFLAGKVRTTCRDFIAVPEDASQELIDSIMNGGDLTLLKLDHAHANGTIDQLVQFITHNPFNKDILEVLGLIERNFEKRTGMTPLMYGESAKQLRSAREADVKREMTSIRPDDYAERVESALTTASRKEALAAQTILRGNDVGPVFGEKPQTVMTPLGPHTQPGYYSSLWDQFVATDDFAEAANEFDYHIEAGSIRKPNKSKEIANIDETFQFLFPALMENYHMTGNPEAVNNYLRKWAESRDMDPSTLQLPPIQPPAPPGQGGPPGNQPRPMAA